MGQGTSQIFPVVGSTFTVPNPLPTEDLSDGIPGAVAPTTAMQVAGTDGTDLRVLLTDVPGRLMVVGAEPNGAALGGNPVLLAGSDGYYVRDIATDSLGQVKSARVAQTPGAPAAANVTGSSATVVPANPNRTGLVLINTSAFPISLAFGANNAVLNSGITLGTNAEFAMDAFTFFLGSVNAIGGSASCNLAIQEFS